METWVGWFEAWLDNYRSRHCPALIHESDEIAERVRCALPLVDGACPKHGSFFRPRRMIGE